MCLGVYAYKKFNDKSAHSSKPIFRHLVELFVRIFFCNLTPLKKDTSHTCDVLRTDFSKVYRSISGITGHPLKKNLVIYLSLGCCLQKSVVNISFRSQMADVKLVAPPKKNYLKFSADLCCLLFEISKN
jgi:hypothetical protein